MKHLLNNLSEEEKNAIREQHAGGIKLMVENFRKLTNSKLGDVKPLVNEQNIIGNLVSGSSQKAVKQIFDSCRSVSKSPIVTNKIVDAIYKAVQGVGTDESSILRALSSIPNFNTFCSAVNNYRTTYGTDLYSDLDGDIDEETLWAEISRILRRIQQSPAAKPTQGKAPQKPMADVKPTQGKVPQRPMATTSKSTQGAVPQRPMADVKPTQGAVPQRPTQERNPKSPY